MKRFTEAGRLSLQQGNLYAALSLALTLPDICASLEDPGPGKSQRRYVRWCKQWLESKFTTQWPDATSQIFVTAEDCYQLRCSLIHSGTTEMDPSKQTTVSKFEFFDNTTGVHKTIVRGVTINGVPQPSFCQLKADLFSEEMFKAADEWDAAMVGNAAVQREKAKLLTIRSRGTTLAGVHFG